MHPVILLANLIIATHSFQKHRSIFGCVHELSDTFIKLSFSKVAYNDKFEDSPHLVS